MQTIVRDCGFKDIDQFRFPERSGCRHWAPCCLVKAYDSFILSIKCTGMPVIGVRLEVLRVGRFTFVIVRTNNFE